MTNTPTSNAPSAPGSVTATMSVGNIRSGLDRFFRSNTFRVLFIVLIVAVYVFMPGNGPITGLAVNLGLPRDARPWLALNLPGFGFLLANGSHVLALSVGTVFALWVRGARQAPKPVTPTSNP